MRRTQLKLELINGNNPEDFLQRRFAIGRPPQAVLPKRLHALFRRDFLQRAGRQLLQNGVAENLVHNQHFAQGRPAGKSRVQTFLAPCAASKTGLLSEVSWQQAKMARLRGIWLSAERAVPTDQAQSDDADD